MVWHGVVGYVSANASVVRGLGVCLVLAASSQGLPQAHLFRPAIVPPAIRGFSGPEGAVKNATFGDRRPDLAISRRAHQSAYWERKRPGHPQKGEKHLRLHPHPWVRAKDPGRAVLLSGSQVVFGEQDDSFRRGSGVAYFPAQPTGYGFRVSTQQK
uniref:Putative secreted protein n=1 Tax=Ixodes ricinus TaxID=34613 RepID=A0A6B0UWE1_IXORI